jgi:3-deoxy-D-manno-octulosonate 8-phosphate phosphatase KdsC-like HAD superfamily phosphatase
MGGASTERSAREGFNGAESENRGGIVVKPFAEFPAQRLRKVRFVLTDVDDTLTVGARLPAAAYDALERLSAAGLTVVPVTAAPSGWCDVMARMWPIAAVIGENGGLCFRYRPEHGAADRHYWLPEAEREHARRRLLELAAGIAAVVPGSRLAPDQRYRETTLVFAAGKGDPEAILGRLTAAGARTAVNSLWLLGWFGEFDKLAMARRMLRELFALDLADAADKVLYVGDSPNDEPMFGFFENSVGVATVTQYLDRLIALPKWVTRGGAGAGFVEIADALLAARG